MGSIFKKKKTPTANREHNPTPPPLQYDYKVSIPSTKERMNRIDHELFEAAKRNNLPEVSRLLSVGADVNAKDNLGVTPLHWASENGHVQVVIELLGHGANIEAKENAGWTPLHLASMRGHVQVVVELLEHGADIEANDNEDGTPLHYACYNSTATVVNELLSRGANIEAKTNQGNTPLNFASLKGNFPVVKALLSGGANILAANNDGRLPVHLAVTAGSSAVIKYLLQHIYATIRRLPLHELLKDLTWIGNPYGVDTPPLFAALHRKLLGTDDVVDILEFLVHQNSELVRSRDQDGSLPLHVACRRGAPFAIVQSLVDLYKASVKSVTAQGDLPLFLACEMPESSLDTIFLLIKLYPDMVYR
jgi:ankyrin repeat protein